MLIIVKYRDCVLWMNLPPHDCLHLSTTGDTHCLPTQHTWQASAFVAMRGDKMCKVYTCVVAINNDWCGHFIKLLWTLVYGYVITDIFAMRFCLHYHCISLWLLFVFWYIILVGACLLVLLLLKFLSFGCYQRVWLFHASHQHSCCCEN